jgi:RNA polymerase sigma-70 factor (ECF subfamily)
MAICGSTWDSGDAGAAVGDILTNRLNARICVILSGPLRIFKQMTSNMDVTSRLFGWTSAAEPDWDRVYQDQLPRVYNFFRYRIRNDAVAEDLTSRTFEKAWRARQRYRRDLSAFGTWLLRIARNVAVDHLRSNRDHAPLEAASDAPAATTPEDEEMRRSDFSHLAALVAKLSEREQELLALKYGAGATNRAIAELTGFTESNVGTMIHRAVQTLRDQW